MKEKITTELTKEQVFSRLQEELNSFQNQEFFTVEVEGGLWLYPNNIPNKGDFVYRWYSDPTLQRGYEGNTLTFKTASGPLELKGPWKSNPHALFTETGIDLRRTILSVIVVYLEDTPTGFNKVLYQDKRAKIGPEDRGERLALQVAKKRNQRVKLFTQYLGGTLTTWKDPDEK